MNSPLKQFCQSFTIPCGFTDVDSQVYTNAAMIDILGMTAASSQVLDVFHAHEEGMRDKKWPLSLLSTPPRGYKEPPQPWRFDFLPRFDEKNVYQGAFFYAQPFLFLSPLEYIEGESPYSINLIQSDNRFSPRERQIIFFTLQRLSSQEVGKKLNLSHRTMENKLQSIYQTAGVHNCRQFINYCHDNGINRYLPPEFLPSGRHVISV
ncbi:helix-turn-helix transcriptional regulator [Candidatus Williamhamiltonella defendens]|uniref:helix-turn-helix transcriptional regulator n=1 Tax=Candidatus Williamhamiltonella defendens TaxID=138072 RepID=UPI00158422BF|nr:helix-turn-helix domain-containing protein [Candidatus Hamiltonella defensa]